MRQANARARVTQGLVVAAGLVLGVSVVVPTGVALAKGDPDHLQCYAVRDSHRTVREAVKLINSQFGDFGVQSQSPLCAPVRADREVQCRESRGG